MHQKSSETSVIRHRDSPIFRAFAGLYSRTLELTHIHATSPAQDDPQRHIPFTPITLYLRGSWFVLVLGWFSSCSRQLSASTVSGLSDEEDAEGSDDAGDDSDDVAGDPAAQQGQSTHPLTDLAH